jgi:hypothetical protein
MPQITNKIASSTAPVTRIRTISIATNPTNAVIKTTIAQMKRSEGGILWQRLEDLVVRVVSFALALEVFSSEYSIVK